MGVAFAVKAFTAILRLALRICIASPVVSLGLLLYLGTRFSVQPGAFGRVIICVGAIAALIILAQLWLMPLLEGLS